MRRSGRYARIAIVAAATLTIATFGTATAIALWFSSGSAVAPSSAGSVPKPNAPTASVSRNVVTVTLPSLPSGSVLTLRGYRVARYAVSGQGTVQGTAIATGGTCNSPAAGNSTCTETISGEGTWQYTVRFVVGASWESAESDRSATAHTTGNGNGNNQGATDQAVSANSVSTARSTGPVPESTVSSAPATKPSGSATPGSGDGAGQTTAPRGNDQETSTEPSQSPSGKSRDD